MPGKVLSIHVHPPTSGGEMIPLDQIDLMAEKGIVQDKRYFGRRSRSGEPSKRQVTLIERREIEMHAAALQLPGFAAGVIRSNIEIAGFEPGVLCGLIGRQIKIGTVILALVEPRKPCYKMDQIVSGLRALMEDGRQGVIARVSRSGTIRLGDEISVVESEIQQEFITVDDQP